MYNVCESIKDVKDILDNVDKKIYFFGCGKIANLIWNELDTDYRAKISGTVVSDVEGKQFHGLKVYSMDDTSWRNGRLILTVGLTWRAGIKLRLEERGYKDYIDISKSFEYKLQNWNPEERFEQDVANMIWRITPHPQIKHLVVNIVDHCNLNCKGCDHFSSIAKERYVTLERLDKDFMQLRRLMNDSIKEFWVMGGEPLLHPDITEILKMNREKFPSNKIVLLTNGILLPKMNDKFWITCKECNIDIQMTKYPIKFDYKNVESMVEKHGINYGYYAGGEEVKTLYHIPLDLLGDRDSAMTYINCSYAQGCPMLSEGKVYPCTIAPNIHIFNEKYGTDIKLAETDGVDLEACKDKDDFITRLCKPMEVCRYCKIEGRVHGEKWCVSSGSIEEWT